MRLPRCLAVGDALQDPARGGHLFIELGEEQLGEGHPRPRSWGEPRRYSCDGRSGKASLTPCAYRSCVLRVMPVGIEPQTAAKPRFAGALGLRRAPNQG